MLVMDSRTNSMEDERHYIGNLLDDDFSCGVETKCKYGGNSDLGRGVLKPTQRHQQQNQQQTKVERFASNCRLSSSFFQSFKNESSENVLFFDPTSRHTNDIGFVDRKSYRDVASLSQKTIHNSQKVNDLNNMANDTKSVLNFNSVPKMTRDSSSRSATRRNNPATAMINGGLQSENSQAKPVKIPGLNPIVDSTSSKASKKALARKQKSLGDFQRINYSKKKFIEGNCGDLQQKNSSTPTTPVSYSPPPLSSAQKPMEKNGKLLMVTRSNSNGLQRRKQNNDECEHTEDKFVNVKYGNIGWKSNGGSTLKNGGSMSCLNMADQLSDSNPKSRFDVLTKIGSMSSPNYRPTLSTFQQDTKKNNSSDHRHMAIEEVVMDYGRGGGKSNSGGGNGKHQRGRLKSVDSSSSNNSGLSLSNGTGESSNNSDNNTGFLPAIFYNILLSLYAWFTMGRSSSHLTATNGGFDVVFSGVNATMGNGSINDIIFYDNSGRGLGGGATSGKRKNKKHQQPQQSFVYYCSVAGSTALKAGRAGLTWIVNLLINFIVLFCLAIVVTVRGAVESVYDFFHFCWKEMVIFGRKFANDCCRVVRKRCFFFTTKSKNKAGHNSSSADDRNNYSTSSSRRLSAVVSNHSTASLKSSVRHRSWNDNGDNRSDGGCSPKHDDGGVSVPTKAEYITVTRRFLRQPLCVNAAAADTDANNVF